MRSLFCAAPLLALAAMFCPVSLLADPVFSFRFSAVGVGQAPAPFQRNDVPGATVSGLIYGLPDDGTGPASEVVITSITGATPGGGSDFVNLPLELEPVGFLLPAGGINPNSFTVVNDVITDASFLLETNVGDTFGLGTGTEYLEYALTLGFSTPYNDFAMFGNNSSNYDALFGTATYSLVSTPEPASFWLMAGVAALFPIAAQRHMRLRM